MKMIKVSEKFYQSALLLAEYIDSFQNEYDSFKEHIEAGFDLEDHIYYHSSVVRGWDIQELLDQVKEELEVDDYKTQKRISD